MTRHEEKALATITHMLLRHTAACTGSTIRSFQLNIRQAGNKEYAEIFCRNCTLSLSSDTPLKA